MTEKKLVPVERFREVALNNGYEVFDEAQVADYAKDTMMKSQAGVLSKEDKDEFAVEMAGLMKAICANGDGSQCTLYYRKPLIDWKVDNNGIVMKGIAGTYTDTPENRKLNRVGQVYVPSPDVIKSIYGAGKEDIEENKVDEMAEQASSIRKSCAVVAADAERRLALGEIDEKLCKSVKTEVGMYLTSWGDTLDECCDVVKSEDLADVREDLADAKAAFADIVKAAHGRYADTAKNRRLHRVGQEYGKAAQEKDKDEKNQGAADGVSGEKPSRNGDSVKRDLSILEENKDKIVEKYGQEAYDKKIESLKKEGEDFEQKETVKQLKERADKQDAEEEERKKAEKRAKRQERRRARHAAKREAAKKAKEEAEAKAKAEAEQKEKQAAEKKEESSEEDTKKKVRAFIKNGLDGAVDKAMKRFVDDFYDGKGEHLNASDYVNSGDFQEYLREELPDGVTTEDLKEAVSSSVKGGIQRMKGVGAETDEKEKQQPEKKDDIESKGKFVSGGEQTKGKKEQSEKKVNGIELTSRGIKEYVNKNSTTPDDRMKAMAEAYKALKDGGKSKKVDTFVKEVSTGSPAVDMTTRKYVEATMDGATHEEAKEFAQKEFETLDRGIKMAQTAAGDEYPQSMIDHLLKIAYAVFDKAKFTKK